MSAWDRDLEIAHIQARLKFLAAETAALNDKLAGLQNQPSLFSDADPSLAAILRPHVTGESSTADKVALFRNLFVGRSDVFPKRWQNQKTDKSGYAPACSNEWAKGICGKPQVKCGECPNKAFIPVTDQVIAAHLRGGVARRSSTEEFVAGVYPLLLDDNCWFLAADFDRDNWAADACAFIDTCRARGIPAALERSRSGNGAHAWIFFSEPIPARVARQLGAAILTETMERRPEIGFTSYDRLFPSQDTMPAGGFGNLIALPLQKRARERGNSVFVDDALRPYDDQWAFLSALPKLSTEKAMQFVAEAETNGRVLGVRMPIDDEDADAPWQMLPSRRPDSRPIREPLPKEIAVKLADQLYVDRAGLPASMIARIIRLAAFQNPEFYRAQAMRLQTFGKPRIISCAELHAHHVAVPRGCLDELLALIRSQGSTVVVEDLRTIGRPLPSTLKFRGALRKRQDTVFEDLARHDIGVLAATTAFGKTVVAAAIIAHRARNTLVIVHRRELVAQWVERLNTFLDIDPKEIGVIGGGRRKPTGIIDVALIQSLVRRGEVADLVANYGHVIVDECHHLSAVSFEMVARRAKARYVLGLSATVARKDGHQPIIYMQCGPIRHKIDARTQAAESGIRYRVRHRSTGFQLPSHLASSERLPMPAVFAAVASDEARNDIIFDDVLQAIEEKRSPIVLTERRDHLEYLQRRFSRFVRNIAVFQGEMSVAERSASHAALRVPEDQERLILATGRYIGEGFDDARLDTLFLTMPISWRGTLTQYVGRLHRQHDRKSDVLVVDYVDELVPVLSRMAARRRSGYRTLGYQID